MSGTMQATNRIFMTKNNTTQDPQHFKLSSDQ